MNTSRADNPAWIAGASYVVEYVENDLGIDLSDTELVEYREENVSTYGHSLHLSDEELDIIYEALQFHPTKFDKKVLEQINQIALQIRTAFRG
jgi:hypothetical protein